jgi:hypothetical protein
MTDGASPIGETFTILSAHRHLAPAVRPALPTVQQNPPDGQIADRRWEKN